jgi:outer membrane autotransporter protein
MLQCKHKDHTNRPLFNQILILTLAKPFYGITLHLTYNNEQERYILMYPRTLKVLMASTAFVAVAAAGHAANTASNIDTSVTDTSSYSMTGAANVVTNTAAVNITGASAITLNHAAATTLTIDASSSVSSNAAGGTIVAADAGSTPMTPVTITNHGIISNTNASAVAIDLTQIQDVGTSNTPIVGHIVNTGTINGNIKLSAAPTGNLVDLTGGTMTGNIIGGVGNDTVTIDGGLLVGDINGAGSGDSDVVNINTAAGYTSRGSINNVETVNVNTDFTLRSGDGISAAAALNVASGKTMTVSQSFNMATAGDIANDGTLAIGAGKTVTTDTYTAGGSSKLSYTIASNNTTTGIGHLALANAHGIAATDYEINIGANAGYIASGTTYTLVDGTAASTMGTLLTPTANGVYRYSLASGGSGNDINLVLGRIATADAVEGTSAKNVGNALDTLGTGATDELFTIQSNIGSAANAAGVNAIVQSLAPAIDGVGAAGLAVTQATGNQVSTRLASLRTQGMAAGDAAAADHVWVQGYGSHAKQDTKDGNPGYTTNGGGATIGVDTNGVFDGVTTGVAFSYGSGDVKSKAAGNGKTDVDNYTATLYTSHMMDSGMFVNSQLAAGYNNYDTTRQVAGIGTATGSTHGYQGSFKMEGGKDYQVSNLTLTPLAGAQYTYLKVKKYTETGAGGTNLMVDPDALNAFDLSAGGQVAYNYAMANGSTLKPALRAKYVYHAGDTDLQTTSQFTGGGAAFQTKGAKADRSAVELGAGLTLATLSGMDLSLDYDADIRSGSFGQTGQLKARWAF